MKTSGRRWLCLWVSTLVTVPLGCAAVGPEQSTTAPASAADTTECLAPSVPTAPVLQVCLNEPTGIDGPPICPDGHELPFAGHDELSPDALVQEVLARNPSLAEMAAAWQAASSRYAQVTSLDDPMFGATLGPASIGSRDVDFGYRVELSQKLPFPGKRGLRGQQALGESAAAGNEWDDMRLRLIEAAQDAFYDYFLSDRALEVNAENLRRLQEAKANAEARYRNNLAPQQDVLQVDVELARQRERDLLLGRRRLVAVARINTLLHLPPDAPLPPAPGQIRLGEPLAAVQDLRAVAVASRPDLQAMANRLAADQAALELAQREFYPDFEVMAAYDAFWQPEEKDLRPQVGLRVNVPLQVARRRAAVSEVHARLAQRSAQLARLTDQVNFQVHEAYEQVRESEQVVRLYETTIARAAEPNVKEALAAYTTGKTPLVSLVEAQRNLIALRDRYFESLADYYRRRATLERVVGRGVGASSFYPAQPRVGNACPALEIGATRSASFASLKPLASCTDLDLRLDVLARQKGRPIGEHRPHLGPAAGVAGQAGGAAGGQRRQLAREALYCPTLLGVDSDPQHHFPQIGRRDGLPRHAFTGAQILHVDALELLLGQPGQHNLGAALRFGQTVSAVNQHLPAGSEAVPIGQGDFEPLGRRPATSTAHRYAVGADLGHVDPREIHIHVRREVVPRVADFVDELLANRQAVDDASRAPAAW